MTVRPTLFLAPTLPEARHAAWQFLTENGGASLLNPPLVFAAPAHFSYWRELARDGASLTVGAPRLSRAEDYFARAYGAMARQRFLSGVDRAWVISGLLARFEPGPNLERQTRSADFASRFAGLIARLRRAGLARFPAGELGDELNTLLGRYESRSRALHAFDYELAPILFAEFGAVNRSFEWPQALLVDDLLEPSPVLQSGLRKLFEHARVVTATLVCPGGIEDDPALQTALEFWRSLGAEVVRTGDFGAVPSRSAARFLGEDTEVERPAHISFTTAHTPWEELNRVAATIRVEVERGARPDDFTVAFADLDGYEEVARHAFASQGVPLDWPRQRSLKSSPLVRALLNTVRGSEGDWNVHELHDLFGDGTLRLRLGEQSFDARRLRNAARAARSFDLADTGQARAAFKARLEQLRDGSGRDRDRDLAAIEASLAAGDLELVDHFQSLCLAPNARHSATSWQLKFSELVDELAGHWLEHEGEAAKFAQESIAALQAAVQRVVERARGWDDGEFEAVERTTGEWLRWLQLELDAPIASSREGSGVRVGGAGSPPEARHTLFMCGLHEGAWPTPTANNWLGEGGQDIEAVLRAGETSSISRATYVLARCLGGNQASLSHARFVGGKERSASMILDDLKAAWPDETHGAWPALAALDPVSDASRPAHLIELNRWMEVSNEAEDDNAANLHLRSLQIMRSERSRVDLGVYDGVLGEQGTALMESWSQRQQCDNLSVSSLERYASCPLRYFFERVLALDTDEEMGEDVDPRTAGNLVHTIAHRFMKSWTTPLVEEDFEAALEKLGEICWSECQKLSLRPILREAEHHRLMGADLRSGPLVQWLNLEIGLGNGAWPLEMRPLSHTGNVLEGVGDGLEQKFSVPIGGQTISGIIDRLDISPDGTHLAVIDYKTGNIANLPTWKSGDDGLHFQLPVYALAARELTRSRPTSTRLSMAYLMMKDAKIARGVGQEGTLGKGCSGALNLPDEQFDAWLSDVEERVARIASLKKSGTFNISLQSTSVAKCDNCGVKSLCGQQVTLQTNRLEALKGSPTLYAPELRKWED